MLLTPESKISNRDDETNTLLVFLKIKGCKAELKKSLHLNPAEKGSGELDISLNHDQFLRA
ncbi:MAG TPA: hypothetical protein DCF68_03820 [Cyanothece sp. UBA12306]|nr:hypothetical protein [Cyanothece sp. UBA12306]